MHIWVKSGLVAVVMLGASLPAWAETPAIDQHQVNQQQRINQGVQSGTLNPNEAARLQRDQDRIQGMETRAKADGVVTPAERRRLRTAQEAESRRIARLKHNKR